MNEQELNAKFQQFERQIMQLQEQLRVVEQAIFDMATISVGLDEIKGKTGKEIMAPIGRGIFLKANLVSETITVDVGGNNYVEKSVDETKEMIAVQKEKMQGLKKELEDELEKINQEVTKTMQEHQKNQLE